MLEQYEGNTFSSKFSDADIHWHLWNEVVEKMKYVDIYDEHEMNRFTIERFKRWVYNDMVYYNIIEEDCFPGTDYLDRSLCVLCVLNLTCDTCPLGRCYEQGHLYLVMTNRMREARNQRWGGFRDYVGTKRDVEFVIEIAKEIRDILYTAYE